MTDILEALQLSSQAPTHQPFDQTSEEIGALPTWQESWRYAKLLRMTEQPSARTGRIPADTLSNRIVLARRLAGLTIEEAAEITGLGKSSWANWENGMRPQRETDVIQTIAEHLGIDRDWLMFGGPLTPARGRPTKKAGRQAERPEAPSAPNYMVDQEVGERPGSDTATLPDLATRQLSAANGRGGSSVRPTDTRSKVRSDSSRPMSGRRASPVW
jgi:transcriptional regulator with XRE-family HTH domain